MFFHHAEGSKKESMVEKKDKGLVMVYTGDGKST